MGKMKVHELAKEFKLQSKDLLDKLNNMGYSVKSHLSTLEDSEVDEIRKKLNGDKSKKEDKKNQVKKDKKPIAPVIIRREVTRVEVSEPTRETTSRNDRNDLGVVQRRTDTSMNIKYRTEPRKIGGITTNKKEEVNNKPNVTTNTEVKANKDLETKKEKNEIPKIEDKGRSEGNCKRR